MKGVYGTRPPDVLLVSTIWEGLKRDLEAERSSALCCWAFSFPLNSNSHPIAWTSSSRSSKRHWVIQLVSIMALVILTFPSRSPMWKPHSGTAGLPKERYWCHFRFQSSYWSSGDLDIEKHHLRKPCADNRDEATYIYIIVGSNRSWTSPGIKWSLNLLALWCRRHLTFLPIDQGYINICQG